MGALTIVKKVPFAILYKDEQDRELIKLEKVRLSYPFVGTPSEDKNDDGKIVRKFRCAGMLPKATHTQAKDLVKAKIEALMAEAEVRVPKTNWFLSDGDGDQHEANEVYKGNFIISASDGRIRPTARDKKGIVIDSIEKIDDTFYGGCWVDLLIRPWYFNGRSKNSPKVFPKRIIAGLAAIKFDRDDTPFGSGRVDDGDVWQVDENAGDGMAAPEDDDDL
jgi:hypothetical protein